MQSNEAKEKQDVKFNVIIFRFFLGKQQILVKAETYLVIVLFGLFVIMLGHSLTIYQTNVNYLVLFGR